MNPDLKGHFQITSWDESIFIEKDNDQKLSHAKVSQTYLGDLIGDSQLQYVMSYQSKSSAVFTGLEQFNGSIAGLAGACVFEHQGTFEQGVASSHFRIIPGSGSGELSDISGEGQFQSGEAGQAHYKLTIQSSQA